MFRTGLLVSTAMTAVALLLSGAPTGAYAQTRMHMVVRDPNTRFLCTYGQFLVSTSNNSSAYHWRWTHVAVPVVGHGQTISRIGVLEAKGKWPYSNDSVFTAGVYSNAPSGSPGKLIAGGKGQIESTCGLVEVSIPQIMLQRNTKYWIMQTAYSTNPYSSFASVYWEANPKAKHKAYVQTHSIYYVCSESSNSRCRVSHTSPWLKQKTGPFLKLR